MNGARDAVLQLEVHLGDGVLGEDRGVRDVTCRNEVSSRFWLELRPNDVPQKQDHVGAGMGLELELAGWPNGSLGL